MGIDEHRGALPPGLRSRLTPNELSARLRAVDLVAADIDECLFPGFSQTYLGYLTFFHISGRPRRPADRRLLAQLTHGGLYIQKVKLLHRLGRTPENNALMDRYERSMMDVPRAYFEQNAGRIPGLSFRGAMPLLTLLSRQAVVGFVSFGVHTIALAFCRHLQERSPGARCFAEANVITFRPGPNGRSLFAGYQRPLLSQPDDKRRILRQRLERHGAGCPLVLGNGKDEVGMAREARRAGGLSIGFHPPPELEAEYDLVVRAPDWRPVLALLGAARG